MRKPSFRTLTIDVVHYIETNLDYQSQKNELRQLQFCREGNLYDAQNVSTLRISCFCNIEIVPDS